MLSLALTGTSWAHRLPAGAKFGALAVAMTGTAFVRDPAILVGILAVVVGLYATLGRRALRAGADAMRPVLWIVGLIALWQIWQGDAWGALALALRIFAMMGMANFVTLTTPLPELIALIERLATPFARFGLTPRLPALAVAMMLRFIPELRGRMSLLGMAWRARSPRRPGVRLLAPMTLSLLDDSDHLAEALRARGGIALPCSPRRRP